MLFRAYQTLVDTNSLEFSAYAVHFSEEVVLNWIQDSAGREHSGPSNKLTLRLREK